MNVLLELEKLLKSLRKVVYWNSSKTELMCRCPYCGDSIKDTTHAHLYIKNESPFSFYCQRCEVKGILTDTLFHDLEVDDIDLIREVKKLNKEFFKNTTKTASSIALLAKRKNLKFPKYQFGGEFDKKYDYLTNRLGFDISKEQLKKFRIVNSLDDLLLLNNANHLLNNNDFYKMYKNLDKESICFLSSDCNYAIFRYIHNKYKRRYINLSLNYPYDIGNKVYAIENSISLYVPNVNLIMTEGIIDILSVYNNFYSNKDNSQRVFFGLNGKGFRLGTKILNKNGFLDLDLDLYSDSDIKKEDYFKYLEFYKYNKINIHYNSFPNEKDFGVPADRIKFRSVILK